MIIRDLGIQSYEVVWQAMKDFTNSRDDETEDQIWIVEHFPVYTLGLNAKRQHLLKPTSIPVIACDRGGQITYHGPGQLVVYTLFNIKRLNLGIRQLVTLLEQAMIATLAGININAVAKPDAPGVYVEEHKIGSIGLRLVKNSSYHGLSLNNSMELSPFDAINPCGFPGLKVTSIKKLGVNIALSDLANSVIAAIKNNLKS